jgi:PAS domain S-box-containing protein
MVALDVQEQILNKLNSLVVVLNDDGSAAYVSKSAGQLLGYNPESLLGNNWWEATRFSKPEGIMIKNKILQLFKNKNMSVQTFEHAFRTSYGGKKWIRWNVSYLNDEQLVGIGYDVTDQKTYEKQLEEKNKVLLEQNKEIRDSIYYAKRIQSSALQNPEVLRSLFEESFLLYRPKDIVSGDYYWFYETEQFIYVAAVDCTGHGVPGAMMSMVANSIFKEVFLNKRVSEPSQILYELDKELENAINGNSQEISSDGMDIALVRVDKATRELIFSGAFRSIIINGKDGLIEIRGSRYPIGFYSGVEKVFEAVKVQLEKNDSVYLFSDGFIDQFGGEQNKKLNKTNFKEMLRTANEMPMQDQEAFLEYSFNNWKQDNDQTDDVLVIGFKVG